MKLGTENRNKLLLMAGLMLAAIMLFLRTIAGDGTPAASATAPQTTVGMPNDRSARTARRSKPMPTANSLDPSLRLDLLRESEQTNYRGSGRNIFKAEPETPQIPKPVCTPFGQAPKPGFPLCQPSNPPLPPPPPPINLKFFGFASKPGEPKKVFLSQGDDVFVAGQGEIVDRRYKILYIGPNSVDIEDVLNNNRQTIPLTQS